MFDPHGPGLTVGDREVCDAIGRVLGGRDSPTVDHAPQTEIHARRHGEAERGRSEHCGRRPRHEPPRRANCFLRPESRGDGMFIRAPGEGPIPGWVHTVNRGDFHRAPVSYRSQVVLRQGYLQSLLRSPNMRLCSREFKEVGGYGRRVNWHGWMRPLPDTFGGEAAADVAEVATGADRPSVPQLRQQEGVAVPSKSRFLTVHGHHRM